MRNIKGRILAWTFLLFLGSGCIVNNPDRFQMGGEVRVETKGIMEYITGFKFRVFGGIIITKEKRDAKTGGVAKLPLDALLDSE